MAITMTIEELAELVKQVKTKEPTENKRKYAKTIIRSVDGRYSLEKFIEDFKMSSIHEIPTMNNMIEYYYKNIIANLEKYEVDEYPFVCCDYRRKKFLWNNGGQFEEGLGFIYPIFNNMEKRIVKEYSSWGMDNYYKEDDTDENNERRYGQTKDYQRDRIRCVLHDWERFSDKKVKDGLATKLATYFKNL